MPEKISESHSQKYWWAHSILEDEWNEELIQKLGKVRKVMTWSEIEKDLR